MEHKSRQDRIAVLGLGLTGVGTLKNLREEGFDAIGFDRNDYVGGLWQWSTDTKQTTVIKSTVTNVSKQKSCYQDFPFPDEVPHYPNAQQVADYITSYAEHFQLLPHCRLRTTINKVERSQDGRHWTLHIVDSDGERIEIFDRIVVTTGTFQKPFTPTYEGMQSFRGRIIHSQAYKDPQEFAGQTVVVVGLSNTAGDVAVEISKVASKTYVSHRSGARVVVRNKNKPVDHVASRRLTSITLGMNEKFPKFTSTLGSFALETAMKRKWKLQPEWNMLPAPPLLNAPAMVNDHIMSCLVDNTISSLPGIKRFDGDQIEFTNGTKIQADAVVFCTGYSFNYGVLAPEADPCSWPSPEWKNAKHANGLDYPRLYQGMFSPEYPDSLAFIGPYRGHSIAAFSNADLSSQAIAQVWKGAFLLPDKAGIDAWCEKNYRDSLAQMKEWHIQKVGSSPKKLEKWLNEAAGNGMNEMLGWNMKAWKFWWSDRKLYSLIMDGIETPFAYRLFDGRRQKWDGAREAIIKANAVRKGQ